MGLVMDLSDLSACFYSNASSHRQIVSPKISTFFKSKSLHFSPSYLFLLPFFLRSTMEAPILQIIVLKGPRNGEILVCEPKSTIQIGRVMKGNHLALRDPGISQKHLCFRFIQADSRWFVSDLDTSNGTSLNGSRIEASVPVPVSDGDVLEIGEKTKLGVKIVAPKVLEEGNDARGRRITRRSSVNSSRVPEEKVEMEESDQNRDAKLTRNPRKGKGKGKSSGVLKAVDANCSIDSVLEVKVVDLKRKGMMSREKGRGKASTVSEEKENHVSSEARISADTSMVIEEEEEENVGVEEEKKNMEEGRVDFENMTLDEWFDSMKRFLPKVIHEESERIIGILKERALKFDELGSDAA